MRSISSFHTRRFCCCFVTAISETLNRSPTIRAYHFQTVSGRITEIEGYDTVRPCNHGLNRYVVFIKKFPPLPQIFLFNGERNMGGPPASVQGDDLPVYIGLFNGCVRGIENQKHLRSA